MERGARRRARTVGVAARPANAAAKAPAAKSAPRLRLGGLAAAAAAAAAAHGRPAPKLQIVDLTSAPNASVVAVQDGRVVQLGENRRLGRFIVLRDVYGDVFTYAGLGSVAPSYTPREAQPRERGRPRSSRSRAPRTRRPAKAATAGTQAPVTLQVKSAGAAEPRLAAAAAPVASAEEVPAGMDAPPVRAARATLTRRPPPWPRACAREPREGRPAPAAAQGLGRPERDRARQGLDRARAATPATCASRSARPATPPTVDPGPMLAELGAAAEGAAPAGRAAATNALLGATASDVFLLSRAELERTVLSDPGITIYRLRPPGHRLRRDRQPRARGARVPLAQRPEAHRQRAALRAERVHRLGLRLRALHAATRSTSPRSTASPIAGHQGPGTITDLTIRTLLTLPGEFVPHEIVSLMHYPASPQHARRPSRTGTASSSCSSARRAAARDAGAGTAAHSAVQGQAAPAPGCHDQRAEPAAVDAADHADRRAPGAEGRPQAELVRDPRPQERRGQ